MLRKRDFKYLGYNKHLKKRKNLSMHVDTHSSILMAIAEIVYCHVTLIILSEGCITNKARYFDSDPRASVNLNQSILSKLSSETTVELRSGDP